jgi:glycosyltransferase involved in cell wall biosynthesis
VIVLVNAVSAKMGGAVNYLTNLLRHLPPRESGYQFFVFLPSETAKGLPDVAGNIRLCPVPDKKIGGWRRVWWEQVTLRHFLVGEKVDVLYSTANFAMFRCPVRQILLVRNALYFSKLYQDEFWARHSLGFRVAFGLRRWLICKSVQSADIVMTPTQAMLDELRRFVEVESWKGLVNPYGVNPTGSFLPEVKGEALQSLPGTTPVTRLVYVSLYSEHKNLTTLLRAMPLLNRDGTRKFVLKTTVDPAWEGANWTVTYKGDLALGRQGDVAPWVEFLGPLGRQQVQELYREGDLFVFPSLCESFGHPMVEAMAHGLPIVAADTPVNREVLGPAALYFSPYSPEELAVEVRRLAEDDTLRKRLGATGRQRVATHFCWERHALRLLEAASGPSSKAGTGMAQDSPNVSQGAE